MNADAIEEAAALFVKARKGGVPVDRLPEHCRPASAADAIAIQERTRAFIGGAVAGWKVASFPDLGLASAILLRTGICDNGAVVAAPPGPLLGVEAEIAFHFERDLPPRAEAYEQSEIEDAVVAFAGIELVATRYANHETVGALERAADCMVNEGFVLGTVRKDWRTLDLAALEAVVAVNGKEIARRVGGHATKHPLPLAVDLVNELRKTSGVKAGQFITTGAFTGMHAVKPGDAIRVEFTGFGSAEVRYGT